MANPFKKVPGYNKASGVASRGLTAVRSTPKAAKTFGKTLVSEARKDLKDPNSEASRFMRAPLGQYYLPGKVQRGAGFVLPTPKRTIDAYRQGAKEGGLKGFGRMSLAGFEVGSLGTVGAAARGAYGLGRLGVSAATRGGGRIAAGGAMVRAGELGAVRVGGKKTAEQVARTGVQKTIASQARETAAADAAKGGFKGTLKARAAAQQAAAEPKTPAGASLRIFREQGGAIKIEHQVGGKVQQTYSASDVVAGKVKLPGGTRREAEIFRQNFSAVNRKQVTESVVPLSGKVEKAAAAAPKAAKVEDVRYAVGDKMGIPRDKVAQIVGDKKPGFRPAQKAAKDPARSNSKVTTRKGTISEAPPAEKTTMGEYMAGKNLPTPAKAPQAAPAAPAAKPAVKPKAPAKPAAAAPKPTMPAPAAVKSAAKSRLRQPYAGKKTNKELDEAFDEAIRIAEGDVASKPAQVAARAATQAKPKTAPKPSGGAASAGQAEASPKVGGRSINPGNNQPFVSEKIRIQRPSVQQATEGSATAANTVAQRGLASKIGNAALRATGLKPFPKKTSAVAGAAIGGSVLLSNRDKIGVGSKGDSAADSSDEADFISGLPEDLQRDIKALIEVKNKKGEAGIAALVEGLKDAQRDPEFKRTSDTNNAVLSDEYEDLTRKDKYGLFSPDERENKALKAMIAKRDKTLRKHVDAAYKRIKLQTENERLRRS